MRTIEFTRPKLAQLKEEYDKARKEDRDEFHFEGQEIYVPYAKYLIEYLEQQFTPRVKIPIKVDDQMNCPNCKQQLTKIEGGWRCDTCLKNNAWPSLFFDEEYMQEAEAWLKRKKDEYFN